MVKLIIYILVFYIIFLVIRTFKRLMSSQKNAPRDEKIQSKYRNIEEADYKEIDSSGNKDDKE
jgi:large-conductance mechanosensitive channel